MAADKTPADTDPSAAPDQPESHTDMTFNSDDQTCNSRYHFYARGVERMDFYAELLQEGFESEQGSAASRGDDSSTQPSGPVGPSVYNWTANRIFTGTGGEVFGESGKADNADPRDINKLAVFLRDCYVYHAP